jgi:hypothetical protein
MIADVLAIGPSDECQEFVMTYYIEDFDCVERDKH